METFERIDRGNGFGRLAMRAATALILALLVLGAARHAADAKPYNAGMISKGGFIAACDSVGGKLSTKGTVVKCRYPNGASESCNFKKKPVTCNYIPVQAAGGSELGQVSSTVAGQVSADDSTETGPIEEMIAIDER
jgi:hypothetical protein